MADSSGAPTTRRRLLGAAAQLAVWCGLAPASAAPQASSSLADFAAGIWSDPRAAAAIGEAIAAGRGLPPCIGRLEEIERTLGERLGGAGMDLRSGATRRMLKQAIESDFAAGRVLHVEGWVLSEAEGMLLEHTYLCRLALV